MKTFQKGDIVTNDRYAAMGKSFTYVEYHKTARGGDSHEVRNSGGMPDFFGDDAGLYVVNPAPATYKNGDRVEMSGNRPGVVGVITGGPWTSGMALVEFPGSHSQTVHVKNLKLAAPVDNSESIGNRNNRSTNPVPFKVGDVVDGIYDVPGHGSVVAEVFDTGHVITTWPDGSRHVEEKRFLNHAKPTKLGAPFPNETRKSDWELNPPSPFKHDNGGPLKAGPHKLDAATADTIAWFTKAQMNAIDKKLEPKPIIPQEIWDKDVKTKTRTKTLREAGNLIDGDRANDYDTKDDARGNFNRIAKLWEPILGTDITATQVALCLTQLKVSRIIVNPTKADSWIDAAGYIALGSEIAEQENKP